MKGKSNTTTATTINKQRKNISNNKKIITKIKLMEQ
jgi:hypothetical protein